MYGQLTNRKTFFNTSPVIPTSTELATLSRSEPSEPIEILSELEQDEVESGLTL